MTFDKIIRILELIAVFVTLGQIPIVFGLSILLVICVLLRDRQNGD